MKTNSRKTPIRTHEGAVAKRITSEQMLRRSLLSCFLWESEFYEDGINIAQRLADLVQNVDANLVSSLAVETRQTHNLRHAPLLLTALLAKNKHAVKDLVPKVVQRADELAELVSLCCLVNNTGPDKAKKILSAQMKKGLAQAFCNFDEYQLAKYNRPGLITLRDVLFMCHAKPQNIQQEETWKRLIDGELQTPDTWEVGLSTGQDKDVVSKYLRITYEKEVFENLLTEGKLGYMALLRNLRNMEQADVDRTLIRHAILARKGAHKVLPFRFTAAARHAPSFEKELDKALVENISKQPMLAGETVILVDVSLSMTAPLSRYSDMNRMDAAATLASVINTSNLRVFSFSDQIVEIPPRRGMAGVDAIINSQRHNGTDLGGAVTKINNTLDIHRLIVITDEQSRSRVPDPKAPFSYMINVASTRNGVGYGPWIHIDGFSESVIKFINEFENSVA